MDIKNITEILDKVKNDPKYDILIEGLNDLVEKKPIFPVYHLGLFLKNYCKKSDLTNILKYENNEKLKYAKIWKEENVKNCEDKKAEKLIKLEVDKQLNQILSYFTVMRYFDEIIFEIPDILKKYFKQFNFYFSQYNYNLKKYDLLNIDENSHYDLDKKKVIKIISINKESNDIINKIIPDNEGVIKNILENNEENNDEIQDKNTINLNIIENKKDGYIFIKDVIEEKNIFFFKIPKFGSFLCFKFEISNYFSSNSYIEIEKQYNSFIETTYENYEKLSSLKENLETFRSNIEEDKNNNVDTEDKEIEVENIQHNIQEVENNLEFKLNNNLEKNIYFFSIDNLGYDNIFTKDFIEIFKNIKNKIQSNWEENDFDLILNDVKLIKDWNKDFNYEKNLDNLNSEEEKLVNNKMIDLEGLNKEEIKYEISQLKFNFYKQNFEIEENYNKFIKLTELNYFRFPKLIIIINLFLKKNKKNFCFPNTNNIKWRQIRDKIFNDENLNKILYNNFEFDCLETQLDCHKASYLHKKLNELNLNEIYKYCYSLGMFTHCIIYYLECRMSYIVLKRKKYQELLEDIKNKTELLKEQDELYSTLLKEEVDLFNENNINEDENFNEEQFKLNFYTKNDEIVIPEIEEEIIDLDVDSAYLNEIF